VVHIFELRDPPVMLAQHFRQRRLAGPDIPGYSDVFDFLL
jgi:hypothetical protein